MWVHFDRKLQTTLLPSVWMLASPLWHKNLTESCRASELLETLLVALHQWPTMHYYAKILEVYSESGRHPIRRKDNCIAIKIIGVTSPKVLLQKKLKCPWIWAAEGDILLIMLSEKRKSAVPATQFRSLGRCLKLLYSGFRELDRMRHKADLGEQACMFFPWPKIPHVTQGNSVVRILSIVRSAAGIWSMLPLGLPWQ